MGPRPSPAQVLLGPGSHLGVGGGGRHATFGSMSGVIGGVGMSGGKGAFNSSEPSLVADGRGVRAGMSRFLLLRPDILDFVNLR